MHLLKLGLLGVAGQWNGEAINDVKMRFCTLHAPGLQVAQKTEVSDRCAGNKMDS